MLDEVSQSLKNDLCAVMFRDLVGELPFLRGRDASFVALIGMELQPFYALAGEYICRRGVIGLEASHPANEPSPMHSHPTNELVVSLLLGLEVYGCARAR